MVGEKPPFRAEHLVIRPRIGIIVKAKTMKYQRRLLFVLWCLMGLTVPPAHGEFLPTNGQFLMHFDLTGGRGELLFDNSTGAISFVPTQVTEVFLGGSKLLSDSFIGLTVTGSGTFVGDGALFPSVEISDFVLAFTFGQDVVLRLSHVTPVFPALFPGTSNEAFDFGALTVTSQGSLPGSDFFSAISSLNEKRVRWIGGDSYIYDDLERKWVLHDAVAAVGIPEPGSMALVALGLAGLWVARRRQ